MYPLAPVLPDRCTPCPSTLYSRVLPSPCTPWPLYSLSQYTLLPYSLQPLYSMAAVLPVPVLSTPHVLPSPCTPWPHDILQNVSVCIIYHRFSCVRVNRLTNTLRQLVHAGRYNGGMYCPAGRASLALPRGLGPALYWRQLIPTDGKVSRCICPSLCLSLLHARAQRHARTNTYTSVSINLSISHKLPIYLCIYISIYLSNYLSVYLSIYLSTYLPIYLSSYISISCILSISLSIYLFIYLYSCLSIYLSLHLPPSISLSLELWSSLYCPSLSFSTFLSQSRYFYPLNSLPFSETNKRTNKQTHIYCNITGSRSLKKGPIIHPICLSTKPPLTATSAIFVNGANNEPLIPIPVMHNKQRRTE